jgi:hypothetical protein
VKRRRRRGVEEEQEEVICVHNMCGVNIRAFSVDG